MGPADSHARPRIHGKGGKYWGEIGVFFSTFYTENADRDMGGGVQVDQNPRYGVFCCIWYYFINYKKANPLSFVISIVVYQILLCAIVHWSI